MKDALFIQDTETDDIDALVEDLLQNPERVEAIKASLKSKLNGGQVLPLKAARRAVRHQDTGEDADDLWENVPV